MIMTVSFQLDTTCKMAINPQLTAILEILLLTVYCQVQKKDLIHQSWISYVKKKKVWFLKVFIHLSNFRQAFFQYLHQSKLFKYCRLNLQDSEVHLTKSKHFQMTCLQESTQWLLFWCGHFMFGRMRESTKALTGLYRIGRVSVDLTANLKGYEAWATLKWF